MGTIDITAIVLAIISFLSGLGWMLDRKKHRQEVESLRADVKRKEMDLSTEFASKLTSSSSVATRQSSSIGSALRSLLRQFRELIVQPLEDEVIKLRTEVNQLRDAIQRINFVFLLLARHSSCKHGSALASCVGWRLSSQRQLPCA